MEVVTFREVWPTGPADSAHRSPSGFTSNCPALETWVFHIPLQQRSFGHIRVPHFINNDVKDFP